MYPFGALMRLWGIINVKENLMPTNMGTIDRRLRLFVLAPVLVVVGLVIGPLGVLPIVLYAGAGVMAATSLAGSCPLYTLIGIRTCPTGGTTSGSRASG